MKITPSAADRFAYRQVRLADVDADAGGGGRLVQHGGEAAARGVAHAAHAIGAGGQYSGDQTVERRAVGADRGLEGQPLAHGQHRDPVPTQVARHEHHVAVAELEYAPPGCDSLFFDLTFSIGRCHEEIEIPAPSTWSL